MTAVNDIIEEVIECVVVAESGDIVCDQMNEKYSNIKLMSVKPIKGSPGEFDVRIELYDPKVWLAPSDSEVNTLKRRKFRKGRIGEI